ncbi:hypothetical protein CBR_g87639, partial [Chara braunii]
LERVSNGFRALERSLEILLRLAGAGGGSGNMRFMWAWEKVDAGRGGAGGGGGGEEEEVTTSAWADSVDFDAVEISRKFRGKLSGLQVN